MITTIIDFFRKLFPFLITIALWRLSSGTLNPGGILALIPVFFCSFVRPVPWFAPFATLVCFLIDYKFGTVLYFTGIYCFLYALNSFQDFIDITRMENDSIIAFAIFISTVLIMMLIPHIGWATLFKTIWTGMLACALYIPITRLIMGARHD